MWWEILPSATIVFVLLNIPHYGGWVVNNIFNNRHSFARRWEVHETDYRLYWRDRLRITGSEYKPQGLEAVPDVD